MLNILINFLFKVVGMIGDIVTAPLIAVVTAVIPSFSDFLDGMLQFFDYAFTYFTFICKTLLIPPVCIQALITVALATLAIMTGTRAYILIVNIYNKFKI